MLIFLILSYTRSPGFGGGGSGSGGGRETGGDDSDNPNNDDQDNVELAKDIAEILSFAQTLRNDLFALADNPNIDPRFKRRFLQALAGFDNYFAKSNTLINAINGTVNVSIELAKMQYFEALAEVVGILAAAGVTAVIAGAAATTSLPVWVAVVGGALAGGAAGRVVPKAIVASRDFIRELERDFGITSGLFDPPPKPPIEDTCFGFFGIPIICPFDRR